MTFSNDSDNKLTAKKLHQNFLWSVNATIQKEKLLKMSDVQAGKRHLFLFQ
ncbi:uncharacterized protein NEPG_01937 [Nematocida parisii ERTm1]|uniref:Uncharacterized protein n=1 Tax=Nematocida parisii (strain ERTm3) TaxID=935791 RepID=I3EEV9_NEMP3|nr:uncharacterized protein NEPG_01937 [Nematocida parisii ERTm1]EIJ87756.1 hypothetical protein NEQG_01828 [Nematocida parisii ERTm3]EIJ92982.1 hypothetical protein NEPG_01937 [Nematocida parisii ERTm1]|eukprot:XP_013059765.1 hypothetical protein NEPG_01937 [Nematocida parisii ERTm1]